jgi:hypothetical protein
MNNHAANHDVGAPAVAPDAPVQGQNADGIWVGEVLIDLNDPIEPPSPTAPLIIGDSIANGNAASIAAVNPQIAPVPGGSSAEAPLIVSSDDDSAPPSQRATPPSAFSWSGPYSLPLPHWLRRTSHARTANGR